jgi:small-conductance mechanosensitive channel
LRALSISHAARLLVLVFAVLFGAAGAEETPASIDQFNQRLDRARATLDEIGKALAQPALTDGALRLLRDRIDPLPRDLQDTIDKLTPRLQAIEARLKELGAPSSEAKPPAPDKAPAAQPPPAAPAKAPAQKPAAPAPSVAPKGAPAAAKGAPPPPAPSGTDANSAAASVNAEWAEQRKLFDEADATLKRARSLLLESQQTTVAIVARERSLFAKTLFLRTNGLFSPALWREAAREAPNVARDSSEFLRDRAAILSSRLANGPRAGFIAVVALIFLSIPPAVYFARRVQARRAADAAPSPLQKAAGAAWSALVAAAVPIAVVGALGLTLDGFDLVDATLDPVLRRIFEGVARVALSYAIARALFAPALPQWRLLDPGDALAGKLVRLALSVAIVQSVERLFEQFEETVQASLAVVVATRGLGALAVAGLLAAAAAGSLRRGAAEGGAVLAGWRRDWVNLGRALAFGAVAVILIACATGYVTFANFFILQVGWIAAVGAVLYIVLGLLTAGIEAAFEPAGAFSSLVTAAFGARREQLAQFSALLSGVTILVCYGVAALALLAPFGVESGDFLADLRAAFFAFKIGDVTISLSSAATAILLFALTFAATQGLRRWLDTRYLPLTRLDAGLRNSISTSLGYAGFILAAAIGLGHLGLGFDKLAIVVGALSVGIGFGLQSIVNNFVSGLILLWERVIRVGDWVVVGDEQGYVKRINVRSTEIETFDRATMIVPNSNLVAGVVKNWLRGDRVGRIKIMMAPHSGVDPEKVRDVLLSAARAQEGVLRIPAPQVMFMGMEASSFRFELWCYVEDVEQSTRVRSDLHFDLHRRLAEAGVKIAAEPPPPSPPPILQLPSLEKLAAAMAVTGVAIDEAIKADADQNAKASETAAAADKPAA